MSAIHDMSLDARAEPGVRREAPASPGLEIVCLSTQPWRIDLPTNRQQIMARVAEVGHDVLYVDTGEFVGRHLAALGHSGNRRSTLRQLFGTEVVVPGVRTTVAPNVVPWGHRFRLAARVNAALTAWMIRRRTKGARPTVLWVYDPWFADCVGKTGERLAVYDCVDDYAEQADPRRRALTAELDALAASRTHLVFTTATTLARRHGRHNAKTHLVGNVGDFAHFAPAVDRSIAHPMLLDLPRPVIGFAGNFHEQKVDVELLVEIAVRRPEWTILLVGPARPETEAAIESLAQLGNVRWSGGVPYTELPRYVAAFDVAIIPYRSNAYTRSCFPLKTFEYLAAGKPVVASGLPELRGMEPHVVVVDDQGVDAFCGAVEQSLVDISPSAVARRRELAAANTWETRSARLLELIAAEL